MAIDLEELRDAVKRHGTVARVVIAAVQGSSPREPGAAMLLWPGGQSGSIGGGTLEYEASRQAFTRRGASRHALGPELGQCCGGSVTLWTETWDADSLSEIRDSALLARGPGARPLAVARIAERARSRGAPVPTGLVDGWMVEPVLHPQNPVWIWGAGHVGRAIVSLLAPLPDLAITWVDTANDRFPQQVPQGVTAIPAAEPALLMPRAPGDAAHIILTYSHALDLTLCHAALGHRFGFCGLIGSRTKWARFKSRLADLGHDRAQIDRITCPIGQKSLGKHPQAIAIGVAAEIVDHYTSITNRSERTSSAWPTHSSASPA
ncbi:xanthine dehydrogenase accessory protein XdhC [Cognatishimia sp. F0-27]|uniref:xanthine dehydrogenase accessory protein XdhC n=1 Tax=Cognatishimia sp. F0-27 TaxID=2816855 RepID=UPI001D0C1EDE|nr:xanthine dehydrogenase accessory protein XdhC [Cognatishimia sp. F0-27]MCC1493927.1 xanthine dehydrogenase accessory protein XdhC [Cognatishimia sp. F0-27]